MLYSLYEAQHMALAPLRFMASGPRMFGHPFSPLAHWPISRRWPPRAIFSSASRALREAELEPRRRRIEVAQVKPFCTWSTSSSQRRSPQGARGGAAFGPSRDLLRDTVRALLAEHDVWITDWINARWCRSPPDRFISPITSITCASGLRCCRGPSRHLGLPAHRPVLARYR